jgi:hypothetical protein
MEEDRKAEIERLRQLEEDAQLKEIPTLLRPNSSSGDEEAQAESPVSLCLYLLLLHTFPYSGTEDSRSRQVVEEAHGADDGLNGEDGDNEEEESSASPLGASSPLTETLSHPDADDSSPTASSPTTATSSPLATVTRHKGKRKHGKPRGPGECRLRSRCPQYVAYAHMM